MQVVFIVGVNVQGLFIFTFHCARLQSVRDAWRSTLSAVAGSVVLPRSPPLTSKNARWTRGSSMAPAATDSNTPTPRTDFEHLTAVL